MTGSHQLDLSVIIPSFNYAEFIETAINSVIDQAYNAKEIIVVDDGSTDNTKEIIKQLQDKYSKNNIKYFFQNNKGVSAARNYGYKKSNSKYLMFLDADDKLLPDAFVKIYLGINTNKEADMIFGGYRGINYSGKIYKRYPSKLSINKFENIDDVLNGRMAGIRPSSTILKRCVLDKLNFPEQVHVEEDALFFAHVFANFKCISIPEILVEMPRHLGSLRENYKRILESGTHGIDELFDKLPNNDTAKIIKQRVYMRRYLKIARKACISHDYKIATQNYIHAFQLNPNSILNTKHFPRMIKSILMNFIKLPIVTERQHN